MDLLQSLKKALAVRETCYGKRCVCGAVQGYQLVSGNGSFLLCLSLNQMGLHNLEKAKCD